MLERFLSTTTRFAGSTARVARRVGGRKAVVRLILAATLMLPAAAGPVHRAWTSPTDAYRDAEPGDPVAAAWRQGVLDREREALSAWFAGRFDIPRDLAGDIYQAALEEEIDPELAFHLVRVESSFRRTAVSSAGAVGYTQVLPSTAGWFRPGTTRRQLLDPDTNLRVGFGYLRYLLDRYDGDMRLALTAYNRGPGTVDRLLRRGRNPENGYARRVLGS